MNDLTISTVANIKLLLAHYLKKKEKEDAKSDEKPKLLSQTAIRIQKALLQHHVSSRGKFWNVTQGQLIGIYHTPHFSNNHNNDNSNPQLTEGQTQRIHSAENNQSEFFPQKMCDIIAKTRHWCDISSLGPPDKLFRQKIQEGIRKVAEYAKIHKSKENPIKIRILFAHILGEPLNVSKILSRLTQNLPTDCNLQIWVGAWRRGTSWNHSKIIAVDGRYLLTGGHNLWHDHYLSSNPVHDISIELEGPVTKDAHLFLDEQWRFVNHETNKFSFLWGRCYQYTSWIPVYRKKIVSIDFYPPNTAHNNNTTDAATMDTEFKFNHITTPQVPPDYPKDTLPTYYVDPNSILLLTIGRNGKLESSLSSAMSSKKRTSDIALEAMILSAQHTICMTLQDIGPLCFPNTNQPYPGLKWPKLYLRALAKAIWKKNVKVNIILSNKRAVPGNLQPKEALFGHGWSCEDVASEIAKTIFKSFFGIMVGLHLRVVSHMYSKKYQKDFLSDIKKKLQTNLRISYIRHSNKSKRYKDESKVGLHSKCIIIDDECAYIGSQNLYICDLAEWGVILDSKEEISRLKESYWDILWEQSYNPDDVNMDEVMNKVKVNRQGKRIFFDNHKANEISAHPIDDEGNVYMKGEEEFRRSMMEKCHYMWDAQRSLVQK